MEGHEGGVLEDGAGAGVKEAVGAVHPRVPPHPGVHVHLCYERDEHGPPGHRVPPNHQVLGGGREGGSHLKENIFLLEEILQVWTLA